VTELYEEVVLDPGEERSSRASHSHEANRRKS
jgi:hypothetical protein